MSIAAAKRRRRQVRKGNRHLAKIGRPGVPKTITAEQSARRLAARINKEKQIAYNKSKSKNN